MLRPRSLTNNQNNNVNNVNNTNTTPTPVPVVEENFAGWNRAWIEENGKRWESRDGSLIRYYFNDPAVFFDLLGIRHGYMENGSKRWLEGWSNNKSFRIIDALRNAYYDAVKGVWYNLGETFKNEILEALRAE